MMNKLIESYPSFMALEYLNQYWPTPDGENFCVYESGSEFLIGHVKIGICWNSYLPKSTCERYSLHIKQVVVNDSLRGCGVLAVICKRLIDAAESAGIFIGGVARNFCSSLPEIRNGSEYENYLRSNVSGYLSKKREEFKKSKSLLKKYLEYGFCRFDGAGFKMDDRRWKKYCFGFRGSGLEEVEMNDFLDHHLLCK